MKTVPVSWSLLRSDPPCRQSSPSKTPAEQSPPTFDQASGPPWSLSEDPIPWLSSSARISSSPSSRSPTVPTLLAVLSSTHPSQPPECGPLALVNVPFCGLTWSMAQHTQNKQCLSRTDNFTSLHSNNRRLTQSLPSDR
jgi:hypothetical protein